MYRLLTAKHWQIFILTFGLLMFTQIVFGIILSFAEDVMNVFSIMPIIYLVFYLLFFCWLYTTGVNLNKKLPVTVNMNLKKFKLFIVVPALYLVCIVIMMFFLFSKNDTETVNFNPATYFIGFLILIPIHFFAIFCIFYCFYFNAKSLKSVELQRPVTFNDFGVDFILFWFYPIGVWFIQPRINKIFSNLQKESI